MTLKHSILPQTMVVVSLKVQSIDCSSHTNVVFFVFPEATNVIINDVFFRHILLGDICEFDIFGHMFQ